MPLFEDPDQEIQQLERKKAKPRPTVDQRTTALAKQWADEAPWMAPRAAALLAQKGVDPTSPEGQQIARTGVKAKGKRGLGWHTVGDIVGGGAKLARGGADAVSNAADFVTPESVEHVVGGATEKIADATKATTRTAGAVAMAPLEFGQGVFRSVIGALEEAAGTGENGGLRRHRSFIQQGADLYDKTAGQTTLGAGLSDPKGFDLGQGFFPGGRAAERQAENARKAATPIDGHALTIGRLLAHEVVEPGTKPYQVLSGLVDGAVAWYADPANLALKGAGHANEARKLFDAGAVAGARKGVLADQVAGWVESPAGRHVVNFLADEADFDTIWKRTNGKLGAKTTLALADARTQQEVLDILRPQLGVELLEKPTLSRLPEVRKRMDRVRLLGEMPGTHIDPNNIDEAVHTIDAFQLNAKIDPVTRAANNRAMAEANTPAEVYDVVVNKVLRDSVEPKVGKALSRAWKNTENREMAKYFVDEIGENAYVPGVAIDGADKALPTPHLFVEYLNGAIPLPDAREIRRATSQVGRIMNAVPGVDLGIATADHVIGSFWKPMVLLRPSWTVRVVGEEQIRRAAAGQSSLFAHPLSFIADLIGKRGATGITGDVLEESEEGLAALSKGSGGFRGGDLIRTKYKTVYERGSDHFARSWVDELAQLHTDPIAKRLVTGLGEGDGVPTRTGNTLVDVKSWFFDGAGQKFRKVMGVDKPELLTRDGADAYIDSVAHRIQIKTGDDRRLLDLVATGALGGRKLPEPGKVDGKLNDLLDTIADEGVGPVKVKGDLLVSAGRGNAGKWLDTVNQATEVLFNSLMSKPTNYLSRSPSFRGYYWDRVETLIPSLNEPGQAKALANAEKSGLAGDVLARLRKAAAAGTGKLTLDDADLIAKGYGLDKTRELLYDLHKRSQFFDVTRLLFPFGEAWKELVTTWAKIGVQHPNVGRRVQQIVQGARGAGFFYTNSNGEEVFAYPGSAWVNEQLFGAPVPFTGRVKGLSVMTEVLPGVGPMVSMPAGALLPDTPTWDGVRKILLPFGDVSEEGKSGFLESQWPAWLQKLRTSGLLRDVPGLSPSPTQQRLLNNTAFDLLAWEVSAGKRPRPSTLEEIQDGVADNMKRAQWLYVLRGAAQSVAPTAPTPEQVAMDKNGNVMVAQVMRDDLYEMQQKFGYDEGWQKWQTKYDEAAFLVVQSKSQPLVYGAPVTTDGVKWEREHSEVAKKFPDVYGFFAPTSGDFDFEAYSRQFRTGKRQALTPEQAVMLANNRVASAIYDQQRKRLPPRPTQAMRSWLAEVKNALIDEYPGFTDVPGIASKAKQDTAIRQLEQAADDPVLSETDAGQGLTLYLAARAKAATAGPSSTSFRSVKRLEPVRDWLRQVSDLIQEEHPGFTPLWEQIFDRELADAPEENEAAA